MVQLYDGKSTKLKPYEWIYGVRSKPFLAFTVASLAELLFSTVTPKV